MQYYMMTMLIVIIGISLGAEENDGLPPDIDAFIETGMNDWDIPGLAVAVIKADTTVYARGFGVRKLGSDDKVDEHTIFSIASLHKSIYLCSARHACRSGKT